jgi:hypothetical protein
LQSSNIPNFFGALTQKLAIILQVQHKINFEAKQLLPRLHGITNMLSDNPPITLTAELTELLSVSSEISTALGKMFMPTATVHESTTGAEKPQVTEGPPPKCHRHCQILLLPPSPERKDYHAPF